MEKGKKWDLVALASIPLVMTLGNSMLIPVLPTIEKKINITAFQSSMIITVYSIVSIFFIPIAGYLSDQFGRKKVIIPSLIIAGIGGAISGVAAWQMKNPYWIILAGRVIQGIGSSGAFPIVIPTVGDLFKNESDVSKGLGIVETANTFGKVLSPVLGALLAAWAWFIPFLSIPVFALIAIVLVLFLVRPPKNNQEKPEGGFKQFVINTKNVLKEKGDWLYAIFFLGWVCMFVYFGFLFSFASKLENVYNVQGLKRGLIIAIPLSFLCITSFTTGKLIGQKKTVMKWVVVSGFILAASALFRLGFSTRYIWRIIFLSISAVGIGATLPSLDALVTEGIGKKQRGTITGLFSAMRLLGVALGPPVAALLMKAGDKPLFFTLTGVGLIGAIVTLIFIKPPKGQENPLQKTQPQH